MYKVSTNLISFPIPPFFNLISFLRPPYSGGSPPENFFENGLLNRAFFSILAEGLEGGRPNRKGRMKEKREVKEKRLGREV